MTTAYTSLLGLALPVTGELSGTWGDTVNTAITSLLDTAVAGTTSITTDADITLTTTTGASNQARQAIILWNPASGTTTRYITAPAQSKLYTVINASGGTQSIVIRGAGPTTGVTIAKGESAMVAWNGSDFVKVSSSGGALTLTDLTVTGNTILGDAAADTLTVNATSTFAAPVNFQGLVKLPSTGRSAAAALTVTAPAFLYGVASTYTDTTSSGTVGAMAPFYSIAQPTLSTSNVTTYTNAATLYIANAPAAGGSATITNPYAAYIAAGATYLGGTLRVVGVTTLNNNLLFSADATYDIGASGATRPRNYYGSGDIFLANIATGRYVKTNSSTGNLALGGDGATYATALLFNSGGVSDTTLAGIFGYGSGTTLNYLSFGGTAYDNGTMYIKNGASSKYVGINISGMSAALHVLGYGTYGDATTDFIRISSSSSGGTATNPTSLGNIAWYDPGGSTTFAKVGVYQTNPAASTAAWMKLQVNGTNIISMSGSTGYVGINNEIPSASLDVGTTTGYTNSTTKAAGVILGTQGTSGGSVFINTASLGSTYGSGLAVWGTYGATKSAINLTASGVYSGGGYHSDFNLQTTSGTTTSTRLSINGATGNTVIGDASTTYSSALTVNGQDSSTYVSLLLRAGVAATQGIDFLTGRFLDGSGANGIAASTTMTIRSSGASNGRLSLAVGNLSYYYMRDTGSSVFGQGQTGYGWGVNADAYGIDIGSRGGIATGGAGQPFLAYNYYYDGTNIRYKAGSVPAGSYEIDASGQHIWGRSAGGSAGASFTMGTVMVVNTGAQLLINGATSSNGVFTIKNVNPVGVLLGIQNYASTGLIGGMKFDQATDYFTLFNNTNTSTSAINLSTNSSNNTYLITKENVTGRYSVQTQVGYTTQTYNYGFSTSAGGSTATVALGTYSNYDGTYGTALAKIKAVLVYATAGSNMAYCELQATARRANSGTAWITDTTTIYSHQSSGGSVSIPTLYWSGNVLYIDIPTYVGVTAEVDVSVLSGTFTPTNVY